MCQKQLTSSLEKILASKTEFEVIAENFEEWFDEVSYDHNLENEERFELISDLFSNPETPPGVLDILAKRFSDWQYWTDNERIWKLEELIQNPNFSQQTLESITSQDNYDYFLGFYDLGNVMDSLRTAKNLTDKVKAIILSHQLSGNLQLFQSDPDFVSFSKSSTEEFGAILTCIEEIIDKARSLDTDVDILEEMALNASLLHCPQACIKTIAGNVTNKCDGHPILEVDYALALNPNTPFTALDKLSRHSNFHIRVLVALHRATTPDTLESMYNREEQFTFRNYTTEDGDLYCFYLGEHDFYLGHPAVFVALAMNLNALTSIRIDCLGRTPFAEIADDINDIYVSRIHDFDTPDNISDADLIELSGLLHSEDEVTFDFDETDHSDPIIQEILTRRSNL